MRNRCMMLRLPPAALAGYVPAAWAAAHVFGGREARGRHALAAIMLLNPALVIMDHGHFQYNGISLGLAVGAAGRRCMQCGSRR